MRKTPLIIAFIATGLTAQAQSGCRGETLSALAACAAASAPARAAPSEGAAVAPTRPTSRTTIGGTLQPRSMRANPPLAAIPSTGTGLVQPPGGVPIGIDELGTPLDGLDGAYGQEGAAGRAGRDVLRFPDARGGSTGYLRNIPGTIQRQ